jgi:MFS superfamily sulfate permease-like transporter
MGDGAGFTAPSSPLHDFSARRIPFSNRRSDGRLRRRRRRIVATYGIDGLFMCTMMAGVILVVLGATGMGAAVSFIPRPVVVGFTNGIAVLIASTQLRDFFGLQLTTVPGSFWPRMLALAEQARTFSPPTTALAVGALVCILVWNRFVRGIPGYIVVLLAGAGSRRRVRSRARQRTSAPAPARRWRA